MSQDIVADALNQMMNALKAGKESVTVSHTSSMLMNVLAIAKLKNYVKSYTSEEGKLTINFDRLNACKSIKPRFLVKSTEIDKYVRRYLPSKDLGVIIISTSQGLMTHQTAQDKNLGGSLIAYFY